MGSQVDSVGLLAQQSYTQIQNRPKIKAESSPMVEAASFQNTVKKQFNSFANMSPEQILSRIQGAKAANVKPTHSSSSTISNSSANMGESMFGSAVKSVRESLSHHERTARKSLIGESSIIELTTATTEAKNALEVTVKVRDKFLEAFDKVMNMSM